MSAFDLTTLPKQDSGALAKMVDDATPKYLGRISLQYGVSTAVVERKAQIGDFMLGDVNLGGEFKIVVGPHRAEADHWEDGKLLAQTFDNTSEEWARLSKAAKAFKQGVKAGPTFLCFLPKQGLYATLRFARTTLKAAPAFASEAGKVITISTVIQGKKNKYPVPVVKEVHEGATYNAPDEVYSKDMFDQFTAPTLEKKGSAAGGER